MRPLRILALVSALPSAILVSGQRVQAAKAQKFTAVVALSVASQSDVSGKVYDHIDTLKGSGTATGLGKVTVRIDERAYDRNETFSRCNQFVADGFFTGKQGSMQFIYLHQSCRDASGGRDHDSGTFTVIGGTGKYQNAYGSGSFVGRSDTGPTGKANWTFTGCVTFPVR